MDIQSLDTDLPALRQLFAALNATDNGNPPAAPLSVQYTGGFSTKTVTFDGNAVTVTNKKGKVLDHILFRDIVLVRLYRPTSGAIGLNIFPWSKVKNNPMLSSVTINPTGRTFTNAVDADTAADSEVTTDPNGPIFKMDARQTIDGKDDVPVRLFPDRIEIDWPKRGSRLGSLGALAVGGVLAGGLAASQIQDEGTQSIPLDTITSISADRQRGGNPLLGKEAVYMVSITTSAKKPVVLYAPQSQAEKLVKESLAARSSTGAQPVRAIPQTAENPIEQIKQLAELHSLGILSDAEFEAKRTELLSRL